MEIRIQSVNFSASSQLTELINKKLEKLTTYYDRIAHADVFMKLDSHQQIKDKIVEIRLKVPGTSLFVSETSKTFEESLDMAVDAQIRQLKKRKEKIRK